MGMIKCKKCGAQFSDKADACPMCNTPIEVTLNDLPLNDESESSNQQANTPQVDDMLVDESQNKKKKRKKLFWWIGFAIFCCMTIVKCVSWSINSADSTDTTTKSESSIADTSGDTNDADVEFVKEVFNAITADCFNHSFNYEEKYCSKSFCELYKQVLNEESKGEVVCIDYDFWTDSQDADGLAITCSQVSKMSSNEYASKISALLTDGNNTYYIIMEVIKQDDGYKINDFFPFGGNSSLVEEMKACLRNNH